MISLAMKFIVAELNNAIGTPEMGIDTPSVSVANIALHESRNDAGAGEMANSIVATVVNIEEEKTLKNSPTIVREGDDLKRFRPIVFLNIFVLFSSPATDYYMALGRVSRVIQFFQLRNVFTAESAETPFPDTLQKLIFDLHPMTFEQQNHLWGVLGGKMLPSVMYKVRMVMYKEDRPTGADMVRKVRATPHDN